MGTQKNHLNEMVLLSTQNTCLILVRKTYVVGTQKNRLTETVLLSTQKHMLNIGEKKNIPIYAYKISLSGTGAMDCSGT